MKFDMNIVFYTERLEHPTFRHFFAVTQKETGHFVGYCGVGGISYDRTQNEVLYGIDPAY